MQLFINIWYIITFPDIRHVSTKKAHIKNIIQAKYYSSIKFFTNSSTPPTSPRPLIPNNIHRTQSDKTEQQWNPNQSDSIKNFIAHQNEYVRLRAGP